MFSNEVKKYLEDVGQMSWLDKFEKYYKDHNERYIFKLKPLPQKPKRLLGQNGLDYLQMALGRSRFLLDGIELSLNCGNMLLVALAARAHFEITGGVAYFLTKYKKFCNNEMTYDKIEPMVDKLILGTYDSELLKIHNAPRPIRVGKMIDAADSLFNQMSNKERNIFRDCYNFLSEFCHPNNFGLNLVKMIDEKFIVTYFKKTHIMRKDISILPTILISVQSFLWYYDKARKLIMENEEVPIIITKKE